MTLPGIEPRSSGPLENTLTTRPMSRFQQVSNLPLILHANDLFFLWKFILAYRPKEISLRRLFPYFANNLCLRPTTYSFYHSFCKFFLLLDSYQIRDICCSFYIVTYSLPLMDTFSTLSVLWILSFSLLPHPLSYLAFPPFAFWLVHSYELFRRLFQTRSSLSWSFSNNSLLFRQMTKRSLIWSFFWGKLQFSACSYNPLTNFSIGSPALCVLS